MLYPPQWLCIPFAWNHPAVGDVINTDKDWIGAVPYNQFGLYLDYCLLLVFGGIPWQVCDSPCSDRALSSGHFPQE